MREVAIEAGQGEVTIPTDDAKVTRVFLKGLRRPSELKRIEPKAFDELEKMSYSHQARGVPEWCCITFNPMKIRVLPRPTGKMTLMLEHPQEPIADGLDSTWQRTRIG